MNDTREDTEMNASLPLTAAPAGPGPDAPAGSVDPGAPAVPGGAAAAPAAPLASARRRALAGGLTVVASLALVKMLVHLGTVGLFGYSYFVDELYFLACSQHLAWGFVDMPPLFPAITALLRAVVGDSLLAVRLLPALSGAALLLMTGLMARDLGGRRFAQGIAALAVLTAPIWLVMHSIHTMNALDQLFWTGCAWIVLRIVRDEQPRLWLLFGAVAGLGMLNKESMAFFGVAIVGALLLTRERRALRSPWLWLGGLLAVVLYMPNLLWDVQHHFPHFEMLANIKRNGRDVQLDPLRFMAQQVLIFNPVALPLWLGGLVWLLAPMSPRPTKAGERWVAVPAAGRYRVLGLAYLAVMAEMFLLDGRPYYPAPAYPMLLAAGGVALERWLETRRWRAVKPAYAASLALSGVILAPLFAPLLPPETLIRYSQAIGMSQPRIETHRLGPLPQLMADRFGWQEMAQEIARIYHALPPAERAKAAIFGQNYGQAGAIDLFGPALGLPKAISGHLSYFLWGPRGYTGEVMIVMDDRPEQLEQLFRSVQLAGHVSHPYSMPYQHFDVYLCRGARQPLADLWPRIKKFD
ncbi:MAG TPA: glycosyltransferase family 39 protein [Thermoanaerobaculia bacterium]|nr:glycosyltransferase family 39 protein [Thermoanaerobaculia bacterium]